MNDAMKILEEKVESLEQELHKENYLLRIEIKEIFEKIFNNMSFLLKKINDLDAEHKKLEKENARYINAGQYLHGKLYKEQ